MPLMHHGEKRSFFWEPAPARQGLVPDSLRDCGLQILSYALRRQGHSVFAGEADSMR